MTEINRAGEAGSLGHIDSTQRDFREQINALNDAVRQLGGNPEIEPGGSAVNDPLSAPYVLYVDPYIGSDTYVSGDYATKDDGTFEDKMRRISLQRLECGYTAARPFRTISRAIIEAGIITSRDYLNLPGSICGDLVSIVVAPGVHHILNGAGADSVSRWDNKKVPTDAELAEFNPPNVGGLLLPRGCSVISLDLRKTILRPTSVPTPEPEAPDYSNRRAIFKITGGGYYFGFTFMDQEGATRSHHLLDCFQYASKDELDRFYSKIRSAFGPAAGVSDVNAVTRTSEYQIVGQVPEQANVVTDTVRSASPYIYNTSVRSTYGLCGIFADGSTVDGFKSIVVAQFTGVSLQTDLTCWQKYTGSTWASIADENEFINVAPDNIRMDPTQRSFHVRAIKEAVIQEVSVFAIGQGIHHWAESGAQLTVTNSNSNFGGCAGLAEGYQSKAAREDGPWTLDEYRTALNPLSKSGNRKVIVLGTLASNQSNTATELTLSVGLAESATVPGQPDALARDGYSLKEGDYIWVENPGGADYRARLAATPWEKDTADRIRLLEAVETEGGVAPGEGGDANAFPSISSKRVYVRRIIDTRSVEERRYSILASNNTTSKLRLPLRDYAFDRPGNTAAYASNQAVAASERLVGETSDIKVELRYSDKPIADRVHKRTVYYRKGDVVIKDEKHYTAIRNSYGAFNSGDWDESFVHMDDKYSPEGYYTNAQPLIIFDKDTEGSESSSTLGNSITDVEVAAQIESAVDRLGLYYYLKNLNITDNLALAETEETRNRSFSSEQIEFRRPTNIRLFGHAYEWAGYGNYSKALPQYQGEMSASNKFTYYFTNESAGKVYATGFNEEGLQVTPRGLEDITTGEVLSVVDVGNPDRDIDIPTKFVDLEVTDSLTLNFGDIGKIEDHALVRGTNDANSLSDFGVVKLAGLKDLQNNQSAGTDGDINDQPLAVTPKGLNYWKIQNNILSAPSDNLNIYVDPVNGVDRDIDSLVSEPPTRPDKPLKTLMVASEYVNQLYAPQTNAVFFCGPGIYEESGRGFNDSIVFKTKATLKAYDFRTNEALNDDTGGGTTSFMRQSVDGTSFNLDNYSDPDLQPTFLTITRFSLSNNKLALIVMPLTLEFEQEGSVTGFAWWGPAKTLISDKVTDDFWRGFVPNINAIRASIKAGSEADALDTFVAAGVADNPGANGSLFSVGGSQKGGCLAFQQEGTVRNCAFGAMVPRVMGEVAVDGTGLIRTRGAQLNLRGLWLIGNVRLSSGGGYKFREVTPFEFWGHHESLVYNDVRNRPEDGMLLNLGGSPGADDVTYNYTWNNIHLINNSGALAGGTDDTSFSNTGPAFDAVFNSPAFFTTTAAGAWRADVGTGAGQYQGFNGKFGTLKDFDSTDYERTRGMFGYQVDLTPTGVPNGFRSTLQEPNVMVVAGTGDSPDDIGYPTAPGTSGSIEDFDPLNVTVVPFAAGIDVNKGVTIKRNCKL